MADGEQLGGLIATARWADPDYIADKYRYEPGAVWIGRNPHDFDQAIGYKDDRHVICCAGAGGGKGRSFIVNNLALWPGSSVTYDPKGELPYMLAPRRGEGDEYCEGMGQEVCVLDPLLKSDVDPRYLAYFDPLSGLDPDDGELPTWCKRLARSLIEVNEGTESGEWAKRAVRLIALMIQHVVTYREIPPEDRNLIYVLRLLLEGNVAAADEINRAGVLDHPIDPFDAMLREMSLNNSGGGWVASEARKLMRQVEKTPKFLESVIGEATDQLDWFKSDGISKSLCGGGPFKKRFDPELLKSDPRGVSVFIVMPIDDIKTYGPWVQAVFVGIFAAMRKARGAPAGGHPVLAVLDEFSSLGYQDYIATSLDNIRSSGMKLVFIVQNFGKLKKLYGDEMESFFTNTGLELYFGKIGQTATDFLKKELGETEVVRLARNHNRSENETENESEAIAYGETDTYGGSETITDSQTTAQSRGSNWGWSNGVNWSDTNNWGQSEGNSMGRNYGPHVFFEGLEKSTNYGTTLNKTRGGGHTRGGSRQRSGGGNESQTRTSGQSQARGSSWNRSTSKTQTQTKGRSRGYQIGGGIAETFHKKPLIDTHEINAHLRSIPDSDCDHPAYPGLMLVRIYGEEPFFVRRSNYDQDPYFEQCFSADPNHGFVPLHKVPLLGYQYTEDHIVSLALPKLMIESGITAEPLLRPHQRFEAGEKLFAYKGVDGNKVSVHAPVGGRVLMHADQSGQSDKGQIMTIRALSPMMDDDRLNFKKAAFTKDVAAIKQQKSALEMAESLRLAKEKQERDRKERERLARQKAENERWASEREQKERADRNKLIGWLVGIAVALVIAVNWWNSIPRKPKVIGHVAGKLVLLGDQTTAYHLRLENNNPFDSDRFHHVRLWGVGLKAETYLPSNFIFYLDGRKARCEYYSSTYNAQLGDYIYVGSCDADGYDLRNRALSIDGFYDKVSEHGGYYD